MSPFGGGWGRIFTIFEILKKNQIILLSSPYPLQRGTSGSVDLNPTLLKLLKIETVH